MIDDESRDSTERIEGARIGDREGAGRVWLLAALPLTGGGEE